jgi:hypothetical protein
LKEVAIITSGQHHILEDIFDRFGLGVSQTGDQGFLFLRHGFEYYDDAWLRTLMSQCLFKLRRETGLKPEFEQLILLLETFLYRKRQNLLSMWKREPDYCKTIDEVVASITCTGTNTKEDIRKKIRKILSPKTEVPTLEQELFRPIREELEKHNIVLVARVMKPKVPAPLSILVAGSPEDCREQSSYLRLLAENESAPTIFISFVGQDLKSEENEEVRRVCRMTVVKHLTSYAREWG